VVGAANVDVLGPDGADVVVSMLTFRHAQVAPGWRRRRLCTSVLKSCIVQVSPCWRQQRLATLLRTSVLRSCIVQVSPDGDSSV